jgi:hypothetical protein
MTKIEVTDEMEQRFCDYVYTHEGCTYRAALEAALNPPPEPEIVVTEEMVEAAECLDYKRIPDKKSYYTAIYRAMRKLEPKADMIRAIKEGK